MKYYNEFKDVKVGDEVQWNSGAKVTEGIIKHVSQEFECFTVEWSDNSADNTYSMTDSNIRSNLRGLSKISRAEKETMKSEPIQDTTEDKIKELINHLVQVNQTERACEALELLRKYLKSTGM